MLSTSHPDQFQNNTGLIETDIDSHLGLEQLSNQSTNENITPPQLVFNMNKEVVQTKEVIQKKKKDKKEKKDTGQYVNEDIDDMITGYTVFF